MALEHNVPAVEQLANIELLSLDGGRQSTRPLRENETVFRRRASILRIFGRRGYAGDINTDYVDANGAVPLLIQPNGT